MAESKSGNITVMVLGVIIMAFFLLADQFGIGEGSAIGYKQVIGTLVGALVFLIGLIRLLKK